MKLRVVVLCMLTTVTVKAASNSSSSILGVLPTMANGVASWGSSSGSFGVQSYLQNSGINGSNFIGFQFQDSKGGAYYLSDQQLAAFKTACVQPTASAQVYKYSGGAWNTTSLPVTTIAAGILNNYKPGTIVSYEGSYLPLSTPVSSFAYNVLQPHFVQIGQALSAGGAASFTAFQMECIPYVQAALIQIYLGRVATGASGLAGLFSSTPVTYNNNPRSSNNNTIFTNFMQAANYYIQTSQYALAALGLPPTTAPGAISPYSVATSSSTAPSGPPGFGSNNAEYANFGGGAGGPSPLVPTTSNNSASSGPLVSSITPSNTVISLLDSFMGVILVNNVMPAVVQGTYYNVGFGSSTISASLNGMQPVPSNPYNVAFSGSSTFIPTEGTADQWSPVTISQNGSQTDVGRAVGIDYTIAAYTSSNTRGGVVNTPVQGASVAFGTTLSPFSFAVGFSASDSTNNTIVVYDNAQMTGEPIATLNLANFFTLPTPWALVVEVSGFVSPPNTSNPTPCFTITPAALSIGSASNPSSLPSQVNSYLASTAAISAAQGVSLCQTNGQPINQQPELKGVIKLNPYFFPLEFSQAGSSPVSVAPLPSMSTPFTFSMANVYDSAASLYEASFPTTTSPQGAVTGFHTLNNEGSYVNVGSYINPVRGTTNFAPYPMGYLILQGLMNGYLMISTVNVPSGSPLSAVPLSSALQQPIALGTDLRANLTGGMSSFATKYPQPTATQWFATQGFDYLLLRSLMVMRCFLKTLYLTPSALPYMQKILAKPNLPCVVDHTTVYYGQNAKSKYNVFIPATDPTVAAPALSSVTICSASSSTPSTVSAQGPQTSGQPSQSQVPGNANAGAYNNW